LAGISLSYQNKVVGEIEGLQMYGHVDIGALLDDGPSPPPAYLALQVSSWAPILLPRPWRHFLRWWDDERTRLPTRKYANGTHTALSPCLPGLASNQWWAKSLDTMWTVWWHQFVVKTGYVFLYQDPRAGPAQAANHKEPGEHFKVKQAMDGVLPSNEKDGEVMVNAAVSDLASLTVYDLFMRPVGQAGQSGLRALRLRAPVGTGTCEWLGISKSQRRWLAREEG
jgi:hypothetical protein